MTPNNILNMAMLKELDFLAITDHNSTKQLQTIHEIEESYNFILIPGVEVTVKENFDVLCYFKTYEAADKLDKQLEQHLTGEWGRFSEKDQMITDIYDTTKETFGKPLFNTDIPYIELYKMVKSLGGIVILAHIDRKHKSALKSFQLQNINFDGIEIQQYFKDEYLKKHPELNKYKQLYNSDAHSLLQISEKEHYLELEEKTIDAFFDYFTK